MENFARTTHYRKLDHDSMVIVLPIDPNGSYLEGAPCYWDATAKVAKMIPAASGVGATDDAIAEMYLGLALATNPVAHHPKPIKKMAFYIGDVIAKMLMHSGESIDWFTALFAADMTGAVTTTVGGRTIPLGHVIIDAEEFKVARTTFEGEEVSTLMRPSIFKSRNF